jgi:hypothetical protein
VEGGAETRGIQRLSLRCGLGSLYLSAY